MSLFPENELTGYADVDDVLERNLYMMFAPGCAPLDKTLYILVGLGVPIKSDDAAWLTGQSSALQALARMAIEKQALKDMRTLAQYIRLQMKGKLT